jgi:hypothetical protein
MVNLPNAITGGSSTATYHFLLTFYSFPILPFPYPFSTANFSHQTTIDFHKRGVNKETAFSV